VNSVQVFLLGVVSLDFELDATGDVTGEGRGLGVVRTSTQLINKDTLVIAPQQDDMPYKCEGAEWYLINKRWKFRC
jgi:hypothetical protein